MITSASSSDRTRVMTRFFALALHLSIVTAYFDDNLEWIDLRIFVARSFQSFHTHRQPSAGLPRIAASTDHRVFLLHKDFDANSLFMSSSCVMFADSANTASFINVHLASHACGARLLGEYLSCVALSMACTRHAESIISACDVMI